jgi:hypothetical protein
MQRKHVIEITALILPATTASTHPTTAEAARATATGTA